MKILIAGATGMFGSSLAPMLTLRGHNVLKQGCSRRADLTFDFTHIDQVRSCILTVQPDVIINLIAQTDVSYCEGNLHQAYLINTRVVENITAVIQEGLCQSHLIQFSTDHVYDGCGLQIEEDTKLLNNYAVTKYAGELAAKAIHSTILRTNFIGRSNLMSRQSLTDWAYNACINNEPINIFEDVFYNPLSMATLSEIMDAVINKRLPGVYNLGSKYGMSKADSIEMFVKKVGLSNKLITRTKSDFGRLSVLRPKNMQMNVSKFELAFGLHLPTFEDEINRIVKDYA